MVDGKPKRNHFRGKPRPDRHIELSYRLFVNGALTDEKKAHTKNIGVGGAFILVVPPPEAGTTLLVSIPVGGGKPPLDVKAEVRWVIGAASGAPESAQGMGVRFTALDVDQLLVLNEFFASLPATVDHG